MIGISIKLWKNLKMIRSEEFDEWQKSFANVNKLMDVMIHHIEKENKK